MGKAKYNSFEEMPMWDKAMNLAIKIFHLTEELPKKEDFCLTSQIRRSVLFMEIKKDILLTLEL